MKNHFKLIVYLLVVSILLPYSITANAQSFVTKDETAGTVVFDISGYCASLGLSRDTAIDRETYEGLEGLIFHNGEDPLYWVAKKPRIDLYTGGYIAYTAPANGTLSVAGASNKSDSKRYISIVTDPSNPTENIIIQGTETEEQTRSTTVLADTTYYIMGLAAHVTEISFEPDDSLKTYSVNAVSNAEIIENISKGLFAEDADSVAVCVPRYIKDANGAWYVKADARDPFKATSASYEATATLTEPVINVEYIKSEDTVYFAEAEALFSDATHRISSWNGYSGGGFVKAPSEQKETEIIPAGIYAFTIGYKGSTEANFTQPSIIADGKILVSGDLSTRVTGESTSVAVLDEDTALTLNTGSHKNEIDYVHVKKMENEITKHSIEKADEKLKFEDGEVIGCIGDSITHGDEGFESYHEVLYNYFVTNYPNTKLYIKNLGVSSATGAALLSGYNDYNAIDTYLSDNPTMSKVFIMLGMNDIKRELYDKDVYDSNENQRASALEYYKTNLTAIIEKLKAKDIEVILMTPTIYDGTRLGSDGNMSNEGLKECAKIVKDLAQTLECRCIDLNEDMLFVNGMVQTVNPSMTLLEAWYDNVHPGRFGNNVVGYLMLRQLGEGDNNIVLSSSDSMTSNSTITNKKIFNNYVSYKYTLSKLPMAYTEGYKKADEYVSFTENMNQMLVKEDLSDGIYELKIDGVVLGEYTADELKNGVNIAFNSKNPAHIAATAMHEKNIERSHYEVKLQDAVCYLVFNRSSLLSAYQDVVDNKESYLNIIEANTDEMYNIVRTELASEHTLELRLSAGREGLILPNIFTENMVLQEGKSSVYGKGITGVEYTVTLDDGNGHIYTAMDTAQNGRFKAVITDAPASMTPYTLTVESTDEKMVIDNVYVGEVYLLSGQSNMEMRLDHSYNTDTTNAEADALEIMEKYGDRIKFMVLGNNRHDEIQFDAPILSQETLTAPSYTLPDGTVPEVWNDMKESTYKLISLIGMYYAEDILDDDLSDGPVALLCTSVGGTLIDAWMKNGAATCYNGHIAPFEDYGIKGILWYQGESDVDHGNTEAVRTYKTAFPQLINDYRDIFGEDIPFMYVQLASYTKSGGVDFNIARNAQRLALERVKNKNNVAMIVSADTATTDATNIHPNGKDIVAERLYKAAKNIIYGDTTSVYEGPLPERVEYTDGKAIIHFKESSISGGLTLKDGISELTGFEIAGSDRSFVSATAQIVGDTVEVYSDEVENPAYVSYANDNEITLSLYNGAGLPAAPFTTQENMKITAIGDSITYGYGLYSRSTQNYPTVLESLLNADTELNGEYYMYNRGKSGWTVSKSSNSPYMTSDNGSVWNSAKNDRSDIYVIALGTNDSKNGVEDGGKYNIQYVKNGEFKSTYLEMIDELLTYNENAQIYICQPVPSLEVLQNESDEGEINEIRLALVRDAIDEVYSEAVQKYGERIKMVDMFGEFVDVINSAVLDDADTDMYKNPSYQSGSVTEFNDFGTQNGLYLYNKNAGSDKTSLNIDTIHPGANGAKLIAQTLYEKIVEKTDTSAPEPATANKIISFDGFSATAVAEDETAVLYAATYNDKGILTSIEIFKFNGKGEQTFTMKNKADKVMLWSANMQPYDMAIVQNSNEIIPLSDEIALDFSSYPLYVGNASRNSFENWEDQGSYFTLTATVTSSEYDNSDVTWSVSDEETACLKSVNNNVAEIRGKRTGFLTVTAELPNGEKANCSVSVIDNASRLTMNRIEFNTEKLNLAPGTTAELKTIFYPKDIYNIGMLNTELTWSSSDTSVAAVSDGVITAKSNGIAIIKAVSNDVGRSAQCIVTVNDSVVADTAPAPGSVIDMTVGDTKLIGDAKYTWVSDNSYIADIDENGVVTAYANTNVQDVSSDGMKVSETKGTVKLYATAVNGGAVTEYEIRISDAPATVQSVSLNENSVVIPQGESKNLIAVVAPSKILDKNITWSSSDESIVSITSEDDTIYGAAQVKLCANSAGTATITASSGGKSDSCIVTVTDGAVKISSIEMKPSKEIEIDEVYQLTAKATENAANKKLFRICTDKTIATLDREGNVRGYNPGTVKIYAIAEDSLTSSELETLMKLQEQRVLGENAELAEILENAVYAECELTVKNSSPYLRNLHAPAEAITDNSINILWNRSSLLDTGTFKEYNVYINGELATVTEKLGYTANNLEPSTQYTVKVSAIDENGTELISEEITVSTEAQSTIINVLDYGAKGNGLVTDTYAIQKAIDACPENGTVWLPGDGCIYYSGALFLKSNMTFKVDGILIGSTAPKDYPRHITKWEGWRKLDQSASQWANSTSSLPDNHYPHSSLVNAGVYNEGENSVTGPYNAENITICGSGQINSNGYILGFNEGPNKTYETDWTEYKYPVKDPTLRGRAITMHNTRGVYIKDVTVAYSPAWTIHLIYNDKVTIDDIQVISQGNGNGGNGVSVTKSAHIPNGDGIDPESCTNVNVFDVYMMTGDDSFTMKSGRNREGNELDKPNAYIRVTDCITEYSLGGYGYGSENAAGVHDVLFQNITVDTVSLNGFWFKTNKARGGVSENIQLRDVYVTGASSAVHANHTYVSSTTNAASSLPVLRYVTFENVIGYSNSNGYMFEGLDGSWIHDVSIRGGNMNDAPSSVSYGKDFTILDCENTEWELSNTSNIQILTTAIISDTKLAIKDEAYKLKEIDNDAKIIYAYKGTAYDEVIDSIKSLMGGIQTYTLEGDTLVVTSQNGSFTESYIIDTSTDIPTDAYINELSIMSEGENLLKNFDRETTVYNIKVSKNTTNITVVPIMNDINATYVITNNGEIFDGTLSDGTNEILISVDSSDGSDHKTYTVTIDNSYFIAEDFSSLTDDAWGFTGSGGASLKTNAIANSAGLTDGALKLLVSSGTGKTVEKALDNEVTEQEKIHISFDWQSNVIKGKSRYSYFALQDNSGRLIFGMFATGKDKVCYILNDETNFDNKLESFSNSWYRAELDIDFSASVLSGNITNLSTGEEVKRFENEAITSGAENLAKMYANDVYSAATMSIDNVYVK